MTFAAYRIQLLCEALNQALTRGVEVTLLLEGEASSGGQLSFDTSKAFKGLALDQIQMLYWPLVNRPLNNAGKPGKLHVKCAIIDDTAIIGSATSRTTRSTEIWNSAWSYARLSRPQVCPDISMNLRQVVYCLKLRSFNPRRSGG